MIIDKVNKTNIQTRIEKKLLHLLYNVILIRRLRLNQKIKIKIINYSKMTKFECQTLNLQFYDSSSSKSSKMLGNEVNRKRFYV